MIAGTLWRLALVAIAVATAGVQIDRQARLTPAIALSVPEPFRSSAQLPVAAYALGSDNPDRALAEAERLVRRRPLPAEHLRILAQAQFEAGAVDEGSLTIQYAAQRGWRDPLAQESMLRLAAAAGNMEEAARRFTALFVREDTENDLLSELAPQVFAGTEARQTMIEIVKGGERWHSRFLRRGARVMPPDAFAQIVAQASAEGANFPCANLRQAAEIVSKRDTTASTRITDVIEERC